MIDVRASGGSEDEVEGGVWWYFLSFDSLSLLPFAFKMSSTVSHCQYRDEDKGLN